MQVTEQEMDTYARSIIDEHEHEIDGGTNLTSLSEAVTNHFNLDIEDIDMMDLVDEICYDVDYDLNFS
jgi:hypothetical protein